MKRRMAAWALCIALLVCAAPVYGASGWGAAVDSESAPLAAGAVLKSNTYWTDGDYRTEHYIELSPGSALKPTVAGGAALCATTSAQSAAAALEAKGLHVAAGVNGGFFTVSNRVPVGIVVGDGALRSWRYEESWMNAAGFRADGSAVLGKPGVDPRLKAGEETLRLGAINQVREGLSLFTEEFGPYTQASGDGWNIFCVPEGRIPLSGAVALTVERVEAAEGAVAIPAGRAVLSLAGDPEEPPAWIAGLAAGDKLTLEVRCAADWTEVDSAVGLVYTLVENGKTVHRTDATAAPHTALGLRADGGLVLYTIDGRQTGYSVGASLDDVARRMAELGCVTAGALDGGGSTGLWAALPGDRALSQINRPSDGTPRSVINYLFLTTGEAPSGAADRLALYPLDIDALCGAEVPLAVKAIDANGYPAPVPEDVVYTVSDEALGTVENGVFLARGAGSGTVRVSAPGVEPAEIPLTVVSEPDEILLYGEVYHKLTKSLTLEPGQEVDLTARATANHVALQSGDQCFRWELDPEAGAVDGTGHLVPAPVSGSGMLTVSAGAAVESIPITVWSGVPFRDILTTDARFPAVRYVYEHALFSGTGPTTFEPDTVMTRAMLVTVLWRMQGEPQAGGQPGFADVPQESWYGPGVAWAAESGLVRGYSATAFGPRDDLTREQILTILWRFAGKPAADVSRLNDAPDGKEVSRFARTPMAWGLGTGVALTGPDGGLDPQAPMTRADTAEVLMRYLEKR